MKNKIERLLILSDGPEDSKTISGFVVLRENSLEVLGIEDSEDEKNKLFNQLMYELIKDYPEVLNDVTDKTNVNEIINAFSKDGYLIEAGNSDDVITKLFYVEDKKIEIEYADGKTITLKQEDYDLKDEYYDLISILCQQYNINDVYLYPFLCERTLNFGRYKEASNDNDIINSIINNLRVHRKLIALITAGAVLALTGGGFYKLGKKNGENGLVNPVTTPISTQTPTPEPTHEIDMSTPNLYPNIVETTAEPVVELPPMTPNYPTTYMTQDELALEPMPYQIESYDSIDSPELWTYIYPDYEDTINIGDVDISKLNIEKLFEVSNNNMWDLSNYAFNGASNKNLETTPMRIHFEKIVQGLSDVDKYYIKYFGDLRNEIVYQGFNLSNPSKALECNRYVIYELIRCKVYDQPLRLNINGREVLARYSDLGYEAQYVIEQLCWGNYLLMGTDTVEFDGQIYDQDQLGYDVWGLRPEASPKF